MTTDRRDPLRDLRQLRERVDSLFQDVLGRASEDGAADGAFRPAVDAWEDGDRYHVRADLPGVGAGDVTVEVEDGVLYVRGERRERSAPRDGYLRSERPRGPFALSLALPASIDAQAVEARQSDGVLEIVLRKKRDDRAGRVRIPLR